MTIVTDNPKSVPEDVMSSDSCKILKIFWNTVFPNVEGVLPFPEVALARFVKWLSMKESEATVVAY